MKLEYVVALARQIMDAIHTRHDRMATGRLPIVCDMGTLDITIVSDSQLT